MKCRLAALALSLGLAGGLSAEAAEPVDYNRDVKPILAKHCNVCHGAKEQESGLRLDAGAMIRRGGDHGPAVVPGKSGKSLLIEVITSDGDISQMPLDEEPLSAKQIALLKRWIDEGAKFPKDERVARAVVRGGKHWSYQPVQRPKLPGVKQQGWVRNPIDSFILARLEAMGMKPSPEAGRAVLVRRLSFDLLGLPPTLEEVKRFVSDDRPGAYERLVDRLLASPRYGERWGRHWLDVARYADSNGYTIDGARSIWPYRDWVVGALNEDMPFDQFTIEQIAGDMLPGATLEQIVATGFHRNTLINQEGGTDKEQFRVESVVDRLSTTGGAFLGLTVGCSRCHEHKFDPISQREFYQLFAILNNQDEPKISVPSPRQLQRQKEIEAELQAARSKLREYEKGVEQRRQAWEQRLAKQRLDVKWFVLKPKEFQSAGRAKLAKLKDESLLASGKIPASDTYTVTYEVPVRDATALRLEALTHESLPRGGPGLAGNGNFVLTDFKLAKRTLAEPEVHIPVKLIKATADHSQTRFAVESAIDEDPASTGWAINVSSGSLNVDRSAVFVFDEPLAENIVRLTLILRHGHANRYNIGRFRVSLTPTPVEVLALPADIRAALAVSPEKRTALQKEALRIELQRSDPGRAPLQAEVNRTSKLLAALKKKIPTTMVMRERAKPRVTHIHIRGDFLRHGAVVKPNVPEVLPPFPDSVKTPNRLDFARWLVDAKNPLTPRVTMNRLWLLYFGRGIVSTENDFGTQGAKPTHPGLLDWLSVEFVRQKWSLKAMHRLIVTSAVYRQSSRATREQLRADRFNVWLGRQTRLRLEAESIRDVALASAGLLSPKIGGPGVYPPQPSGIYLFTQNKKNWKVSPGEDRYRRGIYTYRWRSSPDPFLTTFDAPSGNVTCTQRVRSNTPLQSLTMANDEAFFEIAQSLASRVLRESPSRAAEDRIRWAFQLCLSRRPSQWELERLMAFHFKQAGRFAKSSADAKQVAPPKLPVGTSPSEGAAWTMVARVLLNLDEFITRE